MPKFHSAPVFPGGRWRMNCKSASSGSGTYCRDSKVRDSLKAVGALARVYPFRLRLKYVGITSCVRRWNRRTHFCGKGESSGTREMRRLATQLDVVYSLVAPPNNVAGAVVREPRVAYAMSHARSAMHRMRGAYVRQSRKIRFSFPTGYTILHSGTSNRARTGIPN